MIGLQEIQLTDANIQQRMHTWRPRAQKNAALGVDRKGNYGSCVSSLSTTTHCGEAHGARGVLPACTSSIDPGMFNIYTYIYIISI